VVGFKNTPLPAETISCNLSIFINPSPTPILADKGVMRHNTLGYLHEPQEAGLNLLTPTLPIFGGTDALHPTTRGATLVGDFRKAETIFSLEPFPLRENVQAGQSD